MLTEQRNPSTLDLDQLSTAEIAERINAEDQTVPHAVARALPQITLAIDAAVDVLRGGGRIFYIGAGTSGRLGIIDAVECVPTFGTPPEWVQGIIAGGEPAFTRSIEGVEDDADAGRRDLAGRGLTSGDLVIGIAASGRTPYVLGGLAYAREIGARTVGIANNAPSPVLEAAAIAIALVTGPEVIAGSTRLKAGTAQKLTLNLISTAVMVKLGKVYGNLMVDVQVKNEKLRHRARGIVMELGRVEAETAADLLTAAGGSAKLAIVMARCGVTAAEAQSRLDAHAGRLRPVIDGT